MTAGFGLEKLGILTARYPRATLLIFIVTLPFFLFMASRIEFSSDIREIFRSTSAEYAVLEEVEDAYPGSGRDILLVVEGDNVFTPEALNTLRFLHLDLSVLPEVKYVMSIFSARYPPDGQGNAASVMPPEITPETDMDALRKQLHDHPLISGKLISDDGKTTMVVVALKEKERSVDELNQVLDEVNAATRSVLEGSGLTFSPTGLIAMRVEIIGALIRDQGRFAAGGLLLGLGLCWFFFRRWAYVLLASVPAWSAVIWMAGMMAAVGQEVNVLTNIIPVLVVVLVFSDALHLLFGIRHNIAGGQKLDKAIDNAVLEVGPACVLTSVTTTLALLSLTLVPHEFISRFGLTAAIGTGLAYFATMALVPAMATLVLSRTPRKRPKDAGEYWFGRMAEKVSAQAAQAIRSAPYAIAGTGVLVTLAVGALYAQNTPHYAYQENLPEGNKAFAAIKRIDEQLGGSNYLYLQIEWPKSHPIQSPETLKAVRDAHEVLESEPDFHAVTSLDSVLHWFTSGGRSRQEVFRFLEQADSPLSARMSSRKNNSVLLTAQFHAIDSSELIPILDSVEIKLDELRKKYPDAEFNITGLTPLSAHASMEMIGKLNQSLAMAIGVIILLMGFAMRSFLYGVASIAPNLLPIAAGGTYLYLGGHGLQFTSVVAFTVAFGIAVDSTIHVLNRYRIERARTKDVDKAVDMTLKAIGPVLIVATLVLICGLSVTVLSELPMVRLYGQISAVVLLTALAGAMVFLPAILGITDKWLSGTGSRAPRQRLATRTRASNQAR